MRPGRCQSAPARPFSIRTVYRSELRRLAGMRAALERHLVRFEPRLWRLAPRRLRAMDRTYARILADPNHTILVAVDSRDRPVGMVTVRTLDFPMMDPARVGRIDDAWVEPRWRRRGVMRTLVHAAADFARRRGARMMVLDFALKNTVSVEAWNALGFIPDIAVARVRIPASKSAHASASRARQKAKERGSSHNN